MIESRLYEELLRKLPTARISVSDADEREPRSQIDGLARPLLILSIAPSDESLWKKPFDGIVEGRQVLFFIAAIDVPLMDAGVINKTLLAKSSVITIDLPTQETPDFTFRIPGEIPAARSATAASLAELDLIYVRYRTYLAWTAHLSTFLLKPRRKVQLSSSSNRSKAHSLLSKESSCNF